MGNPSKSHADKYQSKINKASSKHMLNMRRNKMTDVKYYDIATGIREQFIISQALSVAIEHLRSLEERDELYPPDGEHARPSDRADMEKLLEDKFPLYNVVEEANKEHQENMKMFDDVDPPTITFISDKRPSLDELQKAVGGMIEFKVFDDGKKEMVMDEEGKLKNKPINVSATEMVKDVLFDDDYIVGDVLILSGDALTERI